MIFARYKGQLFVTNYQNGKCTLITNKKFDNNFKSIILPNVFVSREFDLNAIEISDVYELKYGAYYNSGLDFLPKRYESPMFKKNGEMEIQCATKAHLPGWKRDSTYLNSKRTREITKGYLTYTWYKKQGQVLSQKYVETKNVDIKTIKDMVELYSKLVRL